ncbi:hypothetical protein [Oceanobacillus salinisoli]|uniref:hypothetical protein n=1 Tax=Oceanobacillus salinisoli TaxID=2678611 RepID=UPI0012E2797B|nr:hypothetical protein [Oceanobacillus salinisoli]
MTVLFGTVEYFREEILKGIGMVDKETIESDLLEIYSTIKSDILNDFVCDEGFRTDCLQNLDIAYKQQIMSHPDSYLAAPLLVGKE